VGKHVERLGFRDVEVVGIPYGVLDVDRGEATVLKLLIGEARDRGSRVVVIGRTTLSGLAKRVQ
jgi:hypothetical protein